MKEICKNCDYCHPSYKSYVCAFQSRIGVGKTMKKTSANGTCQNWKEKEKEK